MSNWHRKLVGTCVCASLALSSAAALANTRASDGGLIALPVSTAQVGTFPYSSWLIPETDRAAGLWQWLLGGTLSFSMLSAFISNEPDGQSIGPLDGRNLGSNGAN